MIRFRFAILILIAWIIFLLNMERPDFNIWGVTNIDLSSALYLYSSLIMVAILILPELAQIPIWKALAPTFILYLATKVALGYLDNLETLTYVTIIEVMALYITVVLSRMASRSFLNLELTIEDVVLDRQNSGILNEEEGAERVSLELFRAKRAEIPLAAIYCHINLLPQMSERKADRFNVQATFRRRYVQGQIAKNVMAIVHRGDIVMWHGDNLIIAMPGSNHEQAHTFAEDIFQRLEFRLGVAMNIGIATSPTDALVYEDLIQIASERTERFKSNGSNGSGKSSNPFIITGSYEAVTVTDKELEPPLDTQAAASLAAQNLQNSVWAFYPANLKEWFTPPQILAGDIYEAFPAYRQSWIEADQWLDDLSYQSNSSRFFYNQVKRFFDLVLVTLAFPIVFLIGATIGLLIYAQDRHAIFFTQKRIGYGGKAFRMYKFRTMVPDAEAKLKELAAQGLAKLDTNGKLAEPLKLKHDPRVTPLGRILRKTSLDELPQLINVLRGEMSLVGPRPTSWDLEQYHLFQTERLSVRPGVTGLLQVYDRGNTSFEAWVKWDLKYIDKMCLYMDVRLIIMTFMTILFKRKGAH